MKAMLTKCGSRWWYSLFAPTVPKIITKNEFVEYNWVFRNTLNLHFLLGQNDSNLQMTNRLSEGALVIKLIQIRHAWTFKFKLMDL